MVVAGARVVLVGTVEVVGGECCALPREQPDASSATVITQIPTAPPDARTALSMTNPLVTGLLIVRQ